MVDDAGHPTPGPLRFCNVIIAASIRAAWDAFDASVGKGTGVPNTCPAATFWLSLAMKAFRSGGHEHGILIPFNPSQFPFCGLTPAWIPN